MESIDGFEDVIERYWDALLMAIPRVAAALIVIATGVLFARWLTRIFRRRVVSQAADPLLGRFLAQAIRLVLVLGVLLLALDVAGLGNIAAGLLATAGASALVIGFAFKDIGENFLAGIILAFNRPFNLGDTVEVDDVMGKIVELTLRYTHIKTFDGRDVYVPNSDVINHPVFNYTRDGFYRQDFVVGIAYEDDIDAAKALINQVLSAEPDVIQSATHQFFVVVEELAPSTVNLRVRFWVDTKDFRRASLETRGDVIKRIKQAMDKGGFSLPSDVMELKIYGATDAIPIRVLPEKVPPAPTR